MEICKLWFGHRTCSVRLQIVKKFILNHPFSPFSHCCLFHFRSWTQAIVCISVGTLVQ